MDREPVGLPDQFSEVVRAHDEGEALVAPPTATSVAALVVVPVVVPAADREEAEADDCERGSGDVKAGDEGLQSEKRSQDVKESEGN